MRKRSSVFIAKNRLKTLVLSDRVHCIPSAYDKIQRELYEALSKYMELTEDDFHMEISRTHVVITFAGD